MRRSERIPVRLPVRWLRSHGRSLELCTADINEHGMFLPTLDPPTEGSLMHLEVQIADGSLIELFVQARFVGRSVSGYGVGVELFCLAPGDRQRWVALYEGHLRRGTVLQDSLH